MHSDPRNILPAVRFSLFSANEKSLAVWIRFIFNITLVVVRLRLFSANENPLPCSFENFLRRALAGGEWCLCLEACHPPILSFSCDQKVTLSSDFCCIVFTRSYFQTQSFDFPPKLDQFCFIHPHVSTLQWSAIRSSAKQSDNPTASKKSRRILFLSFSVVRRSHFQRRSNFLWGQQAST